MYQPKYTAKNSWILHSKLHRCWSFEVRFLYIDSVNLRPLSLVHLYCTSWKDFPSWSFYQLYAATALCSLSHWRKAHPFRWLYFLYSCRLRWFWTHLQTFHHSLTFVLLWLINYCWPVSVNAGAAWRGLTCRVTVSSSALFSFDSHHRQLCLPIPTNSIARSTLPNVADALVYCAGLWKELLYWWVCVKHHRLDWFGPRRHHEGLWSHTTSYSIYRMLR